MPQPFLSFCSAPDCRRSVLAKGLCGRHYQRMLKYGDPSKTINRQPRYPRQPIAEYMREWRRRRPARWREIAAASKVMRRARQYDPSAQAFSRDRLFVRARGICAYCGLGLDPANWHLDHVVALSKGGTHSRENSVAACPTCNRRKGDMDAATFRSRMRL